MTHFFFDHWPDVVFFALAVLGFILAIASPSAFITYIIIFLCGMMAGRLIFDRDHKMVYPYFLVLIGFLVGFILGTLRGNTWVVIILYILGGILSYQLFKKGYLRDVPY